MALLPYMKQLPRDFFLKNYPITSVVAAPIEEAEIPFVPPEPALGTPLPPPSGGGVPEAPTDGGTYARESSNWTKDWDSGSY